VVDAAGDLNIKISGCPNGCGQHHVAGLGFQGSVRRLGARVLPQYFVMVGGGVGPNGAQFGRLAAKIPARRVPQAVERLVGLYREQRAPGEGATAFFQRVELAAVKSALGDLDKMTAQDATEVDYVDLGEAAAFQVTAMEGECSA
jgi:sulfite reductase (NADPH) hemoprotein beta-component